MTTEVGSWSVLSDDRNKRHMLWTGPGDLDDSTWKTPNLDLDTRQWSAFVFLHGAGTSTSTATFDAWGLWPDRAAVDGSDIRPRGAIQWLGVNGAISAISDIANQLDANTAYTNGWWLSNIATATYGAIPAIIAPELFFLYTGSVAGGDGTLEYIDLVLTPMWR